ncbi:MAG: RHS repeat protein [Pleurocapsa sp. SU_196_0]|nr:RHS repeat protein [Pleurocapsa sp. SU_196_0]
MHGFSNAQALDYVYDDRGRLVGVIDPSGVTARYRYDATGNLVAIDRPTTGQPSILSIVPSHGVPGDTVRIHGVGFHRRPVGTPCASTGSTLPSNQPPPVNSLSASQTEPPQARSR